MKHSKLMIVVGCCLVALMAAGCMTAPTGVAPSTKPLAPGGYTEMGKVKGRAVGVFLLGILPLSEPYPARSAVDRAVKKGGGDAMVDVTLDHMNIMIPPFVSVLITTASGTAVKSK